MSEMTHQMMTDEQLGELLDRYTELLFAGEDEPAARMVERTPGFSMLGVLLGLVRQLVRVLTPVRPSAAFVDGLRADLEREQARRQRTSARWKRLRNGAWNASTIIGAIVSVVALVALLVRIVGSIVMLVTLITRRRRAEAAI